MTATHDYPQSIAKCVVQEQGKVGNDERKGGNAEQTTEDELNLNDSNHIQHLTRVT